MDYKPRILGGMHIQRWMGWFFFRWRDGGKHLETIRNLVGGLEHFFIYHIFGIISPTDFHIFKRGWNHQPGIYFVKWRIEQHIFLSKEHGGFSYFFFGRQRRTTDVFLYSRNQPTIKSRGFFWTYNWIIGFGTESKNTRLTHLAILGSTLWLFDHKCDYWCMRPLWFSTLTYLTISHSRKVGNIPILIIHLSSCIG